MDTGSEPTANPANTTPQANTTTTPPTPPAPEPAPAPVPPAAPAPQPVATPQPAPVAQPKPPMDPAKKKKIVTGIIIGAVALVLVIVAIVVLLIVLKVDYSESYKTAKELKPSVYSVYQGYDCDRVVSYANSTYTSPSSYNGYADTCLESSIKVQDLTKKLGSTAGVKRNSEIRAQFEKFSEGVNATILDTETLEAKLAIYKAWHEFVYLSDDVRSSSTDATVQSAAAPLINSGVEALKTYGEGWLTKCLAYTKSYRDYNNLSYSDPKNSAARDAYQNAQTELKNYVASNEPDIKQIGGLNFDNNSKVYNEWSKLYDLISETYAENYNSGSGDCSEFLGVVYCD